MNHTDQDGPLALDGGMTFTPAPGCVVTSVRLVRIDPRTGERQPVMSLQDFLFIHGRTIDATINSIKYRHDGKGGRGVIPDPWPTYTNAERREWIANDESLYLWAKAEGVQL